MNRHKRIAHYYGDYRFLTVRKVLEELEFNSPQEAMGWFAVEFANVELEWHKLGAGSPYPEGLPNAVRCIEEALGASLEREIGAAWEGLSSPQRDTVDSNFLRIFGAPELAQGSNTSYCSDKFQRWRVFHEDGLAALDASQEEIRARAALIAAVRDQGAERRRLVERAEFSDRFNAQVRALREEIWRLSAPALAKTLASIFFEQRKCIRCHLLDMRSGDHGVYYDLVQAGPAATELIDAAMRIALETRDFSLTATLLLLVWGRRPTWPGLVEAGLAHPDMARTLEGREPSAAKWWRSVVRGHDHEARLAWHGEYNRSRVHYLSELAALAPVDRLRRILLEEKWHLGALPPEYADPAAVDGLSRAERAVLRMRLMRAPSGAWARLKANAAG